MTRLVIVDDEPGHLDRLKIVFEGEKEFSVVGVFQDPLMALDNIERLAPDVLITDIYMPDMDGIELTDRVHRLIPDLPIVALSIRGDTEVIRRAVLAGASGYLLKTESSSKLCGRLREVLEDGAAFTPSCAVSLVKELRSGSRNGGMALTSREREILQNIEEGSTYKETALQFGLSLHTIHNHMKNIFDKLEVNKKYEAVRVAKYMGLI